MNLHNELRIALAAVQRAAQLTRAVSLSPISSVTKSDASPVTIADYGAQAIVIRAIKDQFPNDGVVGEEDAAKLRSDLNLASHVWQYIEGAQNTSTNPPFATTTVKIAELKSQSDMLDSIDEGDSQGGSEGRFWALDPVDGTKGFLRKEQYAVCLALVKDAKVILGAIGCPNLPFIRSNTSEHQSHGESSERNSGGTLFYAVEGEGAYQIPLYGRLPESKDQLFDKENKIEFNQVNSDSISQCTFCESVESGHSAHDRQAQIAHTLGLTKPSVRMDSQAKYCAISRGQGDIYLRLPNAKQPNYVEKIWDHAAGNVLVSEAGGKVTDMYGQPLNFGVGRTLAKNQGVIAAPKSVFDQVLSAVRASANL